MARSSGTTKAMKPPKPTREQKKAARAAAKIKRREQFRAFRQAFSMTRKSDKRLIPYMAGAGPESVPARLTGKGPTATV